jgi:hypothetical protein
MRSPLSRQDLESVIINALAEYDDAVRAEWARIRIEPEKWRCSPWGDEGGGFWVVAVDGDRVLWFNDIEEGFNWSRYSTRGTIDEYLCNETAFTDFLEGIAQEQSEITRARLRDGDLPANLVGPGAIVFRQSTYWDVRAATGATYRVHFRYKVEFAFTTAAYPSIELTDRHPLLVQYDEPFRSLYFSGTPLRASAAADELEHAIRDMSQSWRALRDYAGSADAVERRLRAGHGMLMEAPQSVCAVAARVLEAEGVQSSILGNAPSRPGKRVLLLGPNFVIASGFAFERRDVT